MLSHEYTVYVCEWFLRFQSFFHHPSYCMLTPKLFTHLVFKSNVSDIHHISSFFCLFDLLTRFIFKMVKSTLRLRFYQSQSLETVSTVYLWGLPQTPIFQPVALSNKMQMTNSRVGVKEGH